MTLQGGCVWPDESRRDTFKGTYEYHFINVAKEHEALDLNRDCAALDCGVGGIQRFALCLPEPQQGGRQLERKARALRFLGHFVGDMHQPLHVGFKEDLGGNQIDIGWFDGEEVRRRELHAIWDCDIMRRRGLTNQGQGTELNEEITEQERQTWETFDIASWATESYARAREVAYKNTNGNSVVDGDELRDDYFNRAFPVVKEQLKKAGVRLAVIINFAAGGTLPHNMITLLGN